MDAREHEQRQSRRGRRAAVAGLRAGWPIVALLAILWFPFDWLSAVWPAFGVPFRRVFRDPHDHFIGHTVFFLIVGFLTLLYLPTLRRKPSLYFAGLVLAALVQETIQAFFRGQMPTFTDFNAFKGDALGGSLAFAIGLSVHLLGRLRRSTTAQSPTSNNPVS